jgi:hypothetical protein
VWHAGCFLGDQMAPAPHVPRPRLIPASEMRGFGERAIDIPSFATLLSPNQRHHPAHHLEAFRVVARQAGYLPILLELAVIDDRQMEALVRGVLPSDPADATGPAASFVSAVASYLPDQRLVQAWHRAIEAVLASRFGHSIVAWPPTYAHGVITEMSSALEPVERSERESIGRSLNFLKERLDRLDQRSVEDAIATISPDGDELEDSSSLGFAYEHRYPFRFSEEACQLLGRPSRDNDRATADAVHTLVTAFKDSVRSQDLSEDAARLLSYAGLLVVPFVRPTDVSTTEWLDPELAHQASPDDHPGGCLFAIVVPMTIPHSEIECDVLTQRLSSILMHSALREARLRASIAENRHLELATLKHAILHPCREVSGYLKLLSHTIQKHYPDDTSLTRQLAAVTGGVDRLKRTADLSVAAFKTRMDSSASRKSGSARSLAESLDSYRGLRDYLLTLLRECAQFASWVGVTTSATDRDQILASRIDLAAGIHIDHPQPESPSGELWTSKSYLEHVLSELLRNVFQRSKGTTPESFDVRLLPDRSERFVLLSITNPVEPNQSTAPSSVRLGLHQLEVAADLYGLPRPSFGNMSSHAFESVVAVARIGNQRP